MSADAGGGGDAGGAAGGPDGATDAGTPNDCGLSTAQFGSVPGGFWGYSRAVGFGGGYPTPPRKRHKRKHRR